MLCPEPEGEPLPAGTLIFRIGKDCHLSKQALRCGDPLPPLFELSTDDRKADPPRLSVWVEAMTIADQAWQYMGGKPLNTVVACISVDEVRAIPIHMPFDAINVEWEQARWPNGDINDDAGAEGHCGISGLNQGGGGKMDSNRRRELRSQLADTARISPMPVPHNIQEEYLRVAAYFIDEKGEILGGGCAEHWVAAIRQLRREAVRAQTLATV